jgi:predicted RNA-binding Zn-ribbon protein involved in translation (DUF1610 family)
MDDEKNTKRTKRSAAVDLPPRTGEKVFVCPKCGQKQEKQLSCVKCGVIFSKIRPSHERPTSEPPPITSPATTRKLSIWRLSAAICVLGVVLWYGITKTKATQKPYGDYEAAGVPKKASGGQGMSELDDDYLATAERVKARSEQQKMAMLAEMERSREEAGFTGKSSSDDGPASTVSSTEAAQHERMSQTGRTAERNPDFVARNPKLQGRPSPSISTYLGPNGRLIVVDESGREREVYAFLVADGKVTIRVYGNGRSLSKVELDRVRRAATPYAVDRRGKIATRRKIAEQKEAERKARDREFENLIRFEESRFIRSGPREGHAIGGP